jgi:hypothetical protein
LTGFVKSGKTAIFEGSCCDTESTDGNEVAFVRTQFACQYFALGFFDALLIEFEGADGYQHGDEA